MMRPSKPAAPESARLFSESDAGSPASGVHIANIDGASRGNPGPAAYAVIVRDPEGHIVLELAKRMGRETNNVAEYYALLAALDYATSQGIKSLRIRSDSELLVRQMQGRYKVKSPELKPLHERASKMSRQLSYFAIEHVRRELNRDADALANVALDSRNVSSATPGAKDKSADVQAEASAKKWPQKIRAKFVGGAFVPSAPVDLDEGTGVILDVHISK